MWGCEKFRRGVLAEPQRLDWSERLHWLMCRSCARFLGELRVFDRVIYAALSIDVAPEPQADQD